MHSPQCFSLGKRNWYPALFVAAAAALVAAILFLAPSETQSNLLLPAVAAATGFAYFLYSQHLQETRLFVDLFRQFNAKYDDLNEGLNRIAATPGSMLLNDEDKQLLFDYFNLSAEEYLFFKAGFIDPEVWKSWASGMRYFAEVPRIGDLWDAELRGGSYYGFSLSLLSNEAQRPR